MPDGTAAGRPIVVLPLAVVTALNTTFVRTAVCLQATRRVVCVRKAYQTSPAYFSGEGFRPTGATMSS